MPLAAALRALVARVVRTQTLVAGAKPWEVKHERFTTEADIYYCFRLLLDRSPGAEEWKGHASRVAEDLASVVGSYCQSREFLQRGLTRQDISSQLCCSEIFGLKIYTDETDLSVGKPIRDGGYESHVVAVFRRFIRPGWNVIDLGANVGYFSLLAASLVGPSGSVLSIEPNPRNVRLLEASRRINNIDWLTVIQVAAGRVAGILVLNTSHSNGTTAAPFQNIDDFLASEIVACVPVSGLVPSDKPIHFIKVDVEGAEYNALLGCQDMLRRDHPIIVSEFAPNSMPSISGIQGEDYLKWLNEQGYRLGVILADGSITPLSTSTADVMRAFTDSGVDHIDIVAQP